MRRLGLEGGRGFVALLAGTTVSVIGSALSGFAVSVYAFQATQAVTAYSLIAAAAVVPGLLVAPFAGGWVDRFPRRRVIVLCNALSAGATAALAVLAHGGWLELWHVALSSAFNSVMGTAQVLAFEAATTSLVPPRLLGRASGAAQTGLALAHLLGPATAGVLTTFISFEGIVALDAATFVFAMLAGLLAVVPEPAGARAERAVSDPLFGVRYLRARPGLLGALLFQAAVNFATGMATVLLLPLVLSVATPTAYGLVMSSAGLGMLLGGVTLAAWGGPRRRLLGLWGGGTALALALVGGGLAHSAWGLAACAFTVGAAIASVSSATQVLFQTKVPPALQGRVFAIRQVVVGAALPLAFLVAGPLADDVFDPALREGGALAGLGPLVGLGQGRGVAALLGLTGVLTAAATMATWSSRRVRAVEHELPDASLPSAATSTLDREAVTASSSAGG